MLLVLSQEHKEHLGFLASVDVAGWLRGLNYTRSIRYV